MILGEFYKHFHIYDSIRRNFPQLSLLRAYTKT